MENGLKFLVSKSVYNQLKSCHLDMSDIRMYQSYGIDLRTKTQIKIDNLIKRLKNK